MKTKHFGWSLIFGVWEKVNGLRTIIFVINYYTSHNIQKGRNVIVAEMIFVLSVFWRVELGRFFFMHNYRLYTMIYDFKTRKKYHHFRTRCRFLIRIDMQYDFAPYIVNFLPKTSKWGGTSFLYRTKRGILWLYLYTDLKSSEYVYKLIRFLRCYNGAK